MRRDGEPVQLRVGSCPMRVGNSVEVCNGGFEEMAL
jgi:hypothetical protein